ncbi:4Fe-4S dicluster domain-containing protein [Segetibacter sp. 3557_3]|uniref:4Fe-4S dicluster domain-containing protein n=1 Tax=Segetibacter sp. 3557_3 TaxID=2547429 RepID=UPI00105898EF|nr:4Fe-4S dicluster domain-containing protein [Segetibacter sp. 3557_3]TDH27364.1 4Fe-4S dicluster domain-containing protein [Segetibacter sp. 3557_3]
MLVLQQVLFVLLAGAATWLFSRKVKEISRNIRLGREHDPTSTIAERWKRVVLLALGQKKMFKYPLVAVLHFVIYAGFIIINVEVLEIAIDGIFGTHRIFAGPLGMFYSWLINSFEFLAVLVIVVCVIFLARRNVLKLKRFWKRELDGWPRSDANYILIAEIILMSLFLTMNTADYALQLKGSEHYTQTGPFFFSGLIAPLFESMGTSTLVAIERTCWWLHIAGIFAFLNYLPYSKHLHILMAFPNTYYADTDPKGKFRNMPAIQNEVLYAMQPELAPAAGTEQPVKFGAKDVQDLTWKNLMDAYTCTECGRCTVACPANMTGKLLNPRKIMMDTRDRMEEVGKKLDKDGQPTDDGKTLLRDYITEEELRACTTCQACVEECPVSINPLDIIVQLRRHLIMEESNAPSEWNGMFSNTENNFAPWKLSPDDRDRWTEG